MYHFTLLYCTILQSVDTRVMWHVIKKSEQSARGFQACTGQKCDASLIFYCIINKSSVIWNKSALVLFTALASLV